MTKTRDLIFGLPLKEMEPSLLTHSIIERSRVFTLEDQSMVNESLQMASFLHRNAIRQGRRNLPKDTYISHPLRNAERLFRYGVSCPDLISAAILHDTVEDCATEMCAVYSETTGLDPEEERAAALDILSDVYGPHVSQLVNQVSNPIEPKGRDKGTKREAYLAHVKSVVIDPEVYLIKFSDWVDNAVGLRHNALPGSEGMIFHLTQKYLPLADVFEDQLSYGVSDLVSADGLHQIEAHIRSGRESLIELSGESN